MTAFFKRNEKTTIAELEEYYANQPKKRTGMAWFMAFLSLVITILIIVGLFLAGRWVYRVLTNDNNDEVSTTHTQGEEVDLPTFDSNELGADKGLSFEDSTSNVQSDLIVGDISPNKSSTNSTGSVTEEAASTDEPNADRIAANNTSAVTPVNTSTTTPTTSTATTGEVPNTGAGEIILILPAIAGVAGYAISRKRQLSK